MKKTLLFAAALAAFAANAETFDYGFTYTDNAQFPFVSMLGDENSDVYFPGNYDFIDKYGKAMPNGESFPLLYVPEGETVAVRQTGLAISMLDGGIYKLSADVEYVNPDTDAAFEVMPEENWKYPFLSWGPKGMTRTILMPGWGSDAAWEDKDYNAAVEADWIATKNGVQFTRLGTDGIVSRGDTYFQFPAVTGNVTLTVWAGSNLGGNANQDNLLEVAVTPVVDGVAAEEPTVLSQDNPVNKRYYKLPAMTFDATGKNVAFRVGANNSQLNLMYVRIEGEPAGDAGLDAIIADEAAADAPVYNVLGQRVSDSYKGLVIKGGKKYVQK